MHAHLLFYVGEGGEDGEETIREWLRSSLTEVMVPGRFCRVDSLPATPNGKVDVRLLRKLWNEKEGTAGSEESPVPVKTQPENGRLEAVQNAAGNGLEDRLLRIWSVILGREDLSPDISFFERGV